MGVLFIFLCIIIMLYSAAALALVGSAAAFNGMAPVSTASRSGAVSMMDKEGLKAIAKELNPVIGFYDPLNLASGEFWGDSNEAMIGLFGFISEAKVPGS